MRENRQTRSQKLASLLARLAFLKTLCPDYFNRKENSTINQGYPATSIYP